MKWRLARGKASSIPLESYYRPMRINGMYSILTTIAASVGVTLLLAICAQKLLNQNAIDACNRLVSLEPNGTSHRLILVDSFIGDVYSCVDKYKLL